MIARHPTKPSLPQRCEDLVRNFEVAEIRQTLDTLAGNVEASAETLGISRSTLHRKLNSLGIDPNQYRHVEGCKCQLCLNPRHSRRRKQFPQSCSPELPDHSPEMPDDTETPDMEATK